MAEGNPIHPAVLHLRRRLAATPELSGHEGRTAEIVGEFLRALAPDELETGLGGHGVAALFRGRDAGPSVLLRADMDALPAGGQVTSGVDGAAGGGTGVAAHRCGHDGHMAILAGVAHALARSRPRRGAVRLLFQPAEETGEGARAVLADGRVAAWRPDRCFALHNLPGRVRGEIWCRAGTMALGSAGLRIRLRGRSAHAGEPERGLSPAPALATLIGRLPALATRPGQIATVVAATLGDGGFGSLPGAAVLQATLRAASEEDLRSLRERAALLAAETAGVERLEADVSWHEVFPPAVNDDGAVAELARACDACGLSYRTADAPWPWSEDFAWFLAGTPGALFGLGAGRACPPLHDPAHVLPDEILAPGIAVFLALCDQST